MVFPAEVLKPHIYLLLMIELQLQLPQVISPATDDSWNQWEFRMENKIFIIAFQTGLTMQIF